MQVILVHTNVDKEFQDGQKHSQELKEEDPAVGTCQTYTNPEAVFTQLRIGRRFPPHPIAFQEIEVGSQISGVAPERFS